MTSHVLTGISSLVTNDPDAGELLGEVRDAALVIEKGRVAWYGPATRVPAADERTDMAGRAVLPGFVDSHAHLVFAGDRSAEFEARASGQAYTAGGIKTTVAATREASDDQLRARCAALVNEMVRQGTTTVEIKSGYGLTAHDEARALRIAREFTPETTFLGAHVVAPEYGADPEAYVDLVCGPMLDECAPYARWVDVFVEEGAFTADQARRIFAAGAQHGLLPRVHANQLHPGQGLQLAAEVGAASADHCTYASDDDLRALAQAGVVATLLPAIELSTRSPMPDARRFLQAGVTVALATDCNPGSGYSSSMPLCIALGVLQCGLTPAEAVYAATQGGAYALRRDDIGHLAVGARADLQVLDAPSYNYLAYRPAVPMTYAVYRNGQLAWQSRGHA